MITARTLISLSLVFLSYLANANSNYGFPHGNEFQVQQIYGDISVTCQNGPQYEYQNFHCSAELVTPGSSDLFAGPAGTNADKVTLTATHEDGSTRTKSEKYDASKNLSKKSFNLWIWTLTQRPLLEMGSNKVKYVLTKGAQTVSEGEFTAVGSAIPAKSCPYRQYFSVDPNDCRFMNQMCDRYFWENHNCQ